MEYLKQQIRDCHVTVWIVLSVVTVALIGVVGLDEYKQSQRDAARAAPPPAATASAPGQPPS